MNEVMRQALAVFAQRMPPVVREHEILRVAGWMPGYDSEQKAELAIDEVLKWAQRRCGGRLPREAWEHESFDYLSGGRNSNCIRLQSSDGYLWSLRADDPDKNVAERVWTTEVVVGLLPNEPAKFSARLLVSTPEEELGVDPHVPGFVQQVVDTCGLARGNEVLSIAPTIVESEVDLAELLDDLVDPNRQLPIFVITFPSSDYDRHPFLDAERLQRSVLGLARVIIVTPSQTWALSENLGKFRSVFGGAARVYLPGFNEDADPYAHRLVLADQLNNREAALRCTQWVQRLAATESVRRAKLGDQVLAFSAIRSASLKSQQSAMSNEGASDADQLAVAMKRIEALEKEVTEKDIEQDYYLTEYQEERARAEAAEHQFSAATYRIRQLTDQIQSSGDPIDKSFSIPSDWNELHHWCDQHLLGRLTITSTARRNSKNPEYRDVEQVARCLLWLANDCLTARVEGASGSIREAVVEDGVRNSPCGSDTFDFDWQGRRLSADWHIKNGGNTRDPARCLRIYYCFDEQAQQIIVSDMPAHRRTGAT